MNEIANKTNTISMLIAAPVIAYSASSFYRSAWRDLKLPLEGKSTGAPDDPETLLSLENGSYRVDTEQSTIMWWGRNPNTTHYGNIQIVEGELTVSDGNIKGGVIIDMDSISNINLNQDSIPHIITQSSSN